MVEQVAALAAPYGVPVVAIGGITLARAPGVLAAGAASVCVISDLVSGDPAARAQAFLRALAGEVAGP
jgi:thiamine-phosphate pyrophosphorylase